MFSSSLESSCEQSQVNASIFKERLHSGYIFLKVKAFISNDYTSGKRKVQEATVNSQVLVTDSHIPCIGYKSGDSLKTYCNEQLGTMLIFIS